jgi:hypothetical protein
MANMFKSRLGSAGVTPVGDALPEEVLDGKTFMNANGVQTGTMVNNGAVSGRATADTPYVIPEGYHNGEGQVFSGGTSEKVIQLWLWNGGDGGGHTFFQPSDISKIEFWNISGDTVIKGCSSPSTWGTDIDKANRGDYTHHVVNNIDSLSYNYIDIYTGVQSSAIVTFK